MERVFRVLRGETTAAIAAGGTGTISLKNDLDYPLVVERWKFLPTLSVADAGGAVAGNPLPLEPIGEADSLPPASLVEVQVKSGDESWFNEPCSVAVLDDRAGGFFITQPTVGPKANMIITVVNNTAVAINLEAAFAGYVDKG